MLARIAIGAAKHSQNGIADEFVDGAVVRKNDRNYYTQILVQQFDDAVRFHLLRQLSETPNIGIQDGYFITLPAQSQPAAMSKQFFRYFWRKLPQQIGFNR